MQSFDLTKEQVLSHLNIRSEYEALGIQFAGRENSSGWTPCHNPWKSDQHPSCGVCTGSGAQRGYLTVFNQSNGKLGKPHASHSFFDVAIDFLPGSMGDFKHVLKHYADKSGVKLNQASPPPTRDLVKSLMGNLTGKHRLQLFKERGITEATIKKFEIGFCPNRKRFSFPVYDAEGNLVNIRYHRSEIDQKPKTFNTTNYGAARLWGLERLVKAPTGPIAITEGELDSILLNQETGLPSVSPTNGTGAFQQEWIKYFHGHHVVFVWDCDTEGRNSLQNSILPMFRGPVLAGDILSLKDVRLLGDPTNKTRKDFTDYIVRAEKTGNDLKALIQATPEHVFKEPEISEVQASFQPDFTSIPIAETRAGRFLECIPPAFTWELENSLLRGTLGAFVSNGGTGKSQFALQLGVAKASGIPFLDNQWIIPNVGKCILLFAEDINLVIHHRLHEIIRALVPKDQLKEVAERLDKNLFIQSLTGCDSRLIDQKREPTEIYHKLLERLKSIDDLHMVILDNLSRFYSGDENDSNLATYFCSLLERIAQETGATVLCAHHTNKAAGYGKKALVQESIRGASGLTNAARWQLNLARLDKSEVVKDSIDPSESHRYIVAQVTKKNVGPPEQYFYLRRDSEGVLRKVDVTERAKDKDLIVQDQVIRKIDSLESDGIRYTKAKFSDVFKGQFFGYGRDRLKNSIDDAILKGLIQAIPVKNRNGNTVDVLSVPSAKTGVDGD